ncbi:MAG: NAD(P)/FAD-dependent oxidoreductase [Verrucomicrobiales bacterium]
MSRPTDIDILIVGQGLAGSALAVTASMAGLDSVIADPAELPGFTASRVAAGLITPLTGKKINPSWRIEEWLPFARDFYASAATLLGAEFFHPVEIHRWFAGEDEYRAFQARLDEERIRRWFGGLLPPHPNLNTPQGGFRMFGGGWLDVPAWLDAVRADHVRRDRWLPQSVTEDDLEAEGDLIRMGDLRARFVIFCTGLAARTNRRYFPNLPFRPAGGEVLEIRFNSPTPKAVWNQAGQWVAPRHDGTCLVGATYAFGATEWNPTSAGSAELTAFLAELGVDGVEIVGHRAGVRPILHQSRPVAGFAPENPRIGILNGLGSKGVLTAPWAAAELVAHIRDGKPLDAELDPARLQRIHSKA